MKDPYVVRVGRQLYLYYSGFDRWRVKWGVGVAISRDQGLTWHDHVGPIIRPVVLDHQGNRQPFPVVVKLARRWILLHAGRHGIYAATSPDGLHWKDGSIPALRESEAAGPAQGLLPGDLIEGNGHWTLFYGARVHGRYRPERAVSPRPEGPFRHPRVLITDSSGPHTYLLAADAYAGARVVRLQGAPASGPFLAVIGGSRGFQLVHVTHIATNGTASLDERVAGRFRRGDLLASVASAAITVTFVLDPGASPRVLATAFQSLPGCLLEVSLLGRLEAMGHRSAILWDWSASPVVPIGPPSSWHAVSAENAVMVRASR